MWTFSTMFALHLLILLQLVLSLVLQTAGLLSDYKTCGDQACARLMCRVQALRDHRAEDCRFLSFKKGDMIDVYHKLSVRRSELWAGSKDKDFGYFPKDAVKLDEVFVDEKKEMEMRTQETDFLCIDAFGTIIPSDKDFEDYEFGDQTAESEVLGNSDFDDRVSKSSETNENVEARLIDNDNKDREEAEQSRASWIRSAVSGWFANNAGDMENKEENFRSRKLVMDMKQLDEEEQQTKALDWAEDELSSALGLKEEETGNDEDSTSEQVSDQLGNRIKSVSGLGAGEDTPPSETKKQSQDENMQSLSKEKGAASLKVDASAVSLTEDEKDAGWYDSVFNTITNFYGDPSDKSEASKKEGKARSSDGDTDVDTVTISKDEKNTEARSEPSLIQDLKTADHEKKQEVSSQVDQSENEKLGEGWYGSAYNGITGFYGDTCDRRTADGEENGGGDPPEKSESKDVDPNPGDKLETSEENMTEDNNAGWYSSIYSRISNVYGDPSDRRDVPEVMKESQSQTQSESTKETSSSSTFPMNSPSTESDGLREAGSDDETEPSKSVRSEPNFSADQSDDDDGEASDLSEKDTSENLTDSDRSGDTSQSVFSIKRFLMVINGLKSPFKANNAADTEEKIPDTGEEDQRDKDDELTVRLTEIKVGEEEEEEAVREVEVAEPQTHAVEGSLDCYKQDTGGDNGNNHEVHVDRDKVSGQSDSTSPMSDESGTLTEEPGWTRLPEHISDTSQSLEGDVNKTVPEKHPGEEEPLSESETRPESQLQLRTDVTENNSESVDKSDEAQDEGEAAEMLAETEETAMKVRSSEAEHINHLHGVDVRQVEYSDENQSVNITLMEDDEERAGGDVTETELHGNKEGVDVTPVESAGGIKDSYATRMETDGEKGILNVPQMESSGENTSGEVTRVKNAGEQDEVNIPQNETDRQKESVDVIRREDEGEAAGDITQVKSGGEKEGFDIIEKEQLSLHNAQTQNSHSISLTKPNEKIEPDESRESEKPESAALEWSPSTDVSEADGSIASTSDGAQTHHDSKKHRDKMMAVKQHKAQTSAQTQKPTYPNLKTHLSEKDMQVLLRFFSGETLTRLDFIIGHTEYIHSQELAEVHDFKQTLEHLLKTRNQEIKPSLQTIHTVLAMLPKTFRPVIADGSVDKSPDPSQTECVTEPCVSTTEKTPISEQDMGKDNSMEINMETSSSTDVSNSFISKSLSDYEEVVPDRSRTLHTLQSDRKTDPHLDTQMITGESQKLEEPKNGALRPYTALVGELVSGVFMYTVRESSRITHAIRQVVMSLPDDIRPGPDLYGVPWEAVIFTAMLGLFTFLLFTCRFFQAIKSRLYRNKERRMGQKVAELLEEKCKVLETLSECEHKFKKLDAALQNGGLSAQASEREDLEVLSKQLEEANVQMQSDMEKMQEELETQDQLRKQQEEQLTKLEEMLKKLEQEAMERKSQLQQDKTTLKIHQMNTERLQKKLQEAKEENSMLQESKAQLEQEAEGWKERLSELEEEKKMCESSHNGMMENCVNKDERIKSLTECLLKMRDWDSEEDCTVSDTTGSERNSPDFRQKQKVQKLINAAKMSADLKAMEEDKDRMFAKLADEIKAKEDLQGGLDQLQCVRESVQSESSMYSSEIEKLQHKLQIMSEMYQEKELKLHRMLTVEEKERSQKEEQLNKAGKKISLATDELNSYRQRAKELEEELEKTNQAYRNQIASHEKKAHDNWLAARAADRDLTDVKRENSVLRQRLTDWQFKLDPQARVPSFRGERSPFGPSPLGRPPSETRPFLSPPTLMDGPPRVSPQFPMMPGGRAPPGGVEGDRSVSYSERGSPTWERERERRSLGPPGPDPGLVYRRPLSAPFLRAPLPPEAYFNDRSESSIGEGAGFNENGVPDNGRSMPGRDIRPGPLPPPPFPLVDPRDPHFPRRAYRPDCFPPPPPPLSMQGLPPPLLPPGVFPRIPLPPHMAFPPMRPPSDHISPEPPSRPSPPGSEQPPEQPPSAHII